MLHTSFMTNLSRAQTKLHCGLFFSSVPLQTFLITIFFTPCHMEGKKNIPLIYKQL